MQAARIGQLIISIGKNKAPGQGISLQTGHYQSSLCQNDDSSNEGDDALLKSLDPKIRESTNIEKEHREPGGLIVTAKKEIDNYT